MALPTNAKTRKGIPMFSGLLKYFPHALAAVAESSRIGNDQHNPGQPLHWAKEKSTDEPDALLRHLTDMAIEGTHRDPDGVMAAVKLAWRALANLERLHDSGVNIFHDEVQVSLPVSEVAHKPLDEASVEEWNDLSRRNFHGMLSRPSVARSN